MKQEHPHAEFLRALADGEPIDNFRFRHSTDSGWIEACSMHLRDVLDNPDRWLVQRKPRTIRIGDVEVQAGITDPPPNGTNIYVSDGTRERYFFESTSTGSEYIQMLIRRGLVHLSEEPAVATGRAIAALTEHKT